VCVYYIRIKIKKKNTQYSSGIFPIGFQTYGLPKFGPSKIKKIIITIILLLLLLYGLCKKLRGRSATERRPGETPFLLNDIITYYNVMSATV